MIRYSITLLLFVFQIFVAKATTLSIVSWNLFDFGKTKSEEEIKREPFLGRFQTNNKEFLLMNFHAISKDAASEVEYIPTIISKYPNDRLIIASDFNVADSHPTMKSIYSMGFSPALINQKTTLKETLGDNGDYLFASKDNIVVMDDYFEIVESGIINIMKHLGDLNTARNISDHVGIWIKVTFKE